jgi:hypothetical protein
MRFLLNLLGCAAIAAALTVFAIEFIVGCGETYVDANGERHQYECVFIPQQPVEPK